MLQLTPATVKHWETTYTLLQYESVFIMINTTNLSAEILMIWRIRQMKKDISGDVRNLATGLIRDFIIAVICDQTTESVNWHDIIYNDYQQYITSCEAQINASDANNSQKGRAIVNKKKAQQSAKFFADAYMSESDTNLDETIDISFMYTIIQYTSKERFMNACDAHLSVILQKISDCKAARNKVSHATDVSPFSDQIYFLLSTKNLLDELSVWNMAPESFTAKLSHYQTQYQEISDLVDEITDSKDNHDPLLCYLYNLTKQKQTLQKQYVPLHYSLFDSPAALTQADSETSIDWNQVCKLMESKTLCQLYGAPGSGKTWTLQNYAGELAENFLSKYDEHKAEHSAPLPLYLHLDTNCTPKEAAAAIYTLVRDTLFPNDPLSSRRITDFLANGHFILLIDGFFCEYWNTAVANALEPLIKIHFTDIQNNAHAKCFIGLPASFASPKPVKLPVPENSMRLFVCDVDMNFCTSYLEKRVTNESSPFNLYDIVKAMGFAHKTPSIAACVIDYYINSLGGACFRNPNHKIEAFRYLNFASINHRIVDELLPEYIFVSCSRNKNFPVQKNDAVLAFFKELLCNLCTAFHDSDLDGGAHKELVEDIIQYTLQKHGNPFTKDEIVAKFLLYGILSEGSSSINGHPIEQMHFGNRKLYDIPTYWHTSGMKCIHEISFQPDYYMYGKLYSMDPCGNRIPNYSIVEY